MARLIPLALFLSGALAATSKSCTADLPLSCHNTTTVKDTCCFIPAGQILQTQFWDTDPVAGPTG